MRREAAVIGGGPAGSAVAILLARAGRDVHLLEQEAGPRHTVCGEFLSWEACHYLRAIGLDLPALGARPVRRLALIDGAAVLETPLPFTAWSLSRRRLDEALLEQAERAGVALRRGETVRELAPCEGEAWRLRIDGGEVRAAAVFLASGKHELRDWPRAGKRRPDRIGFKMHLRLAPRQRETLEGRVEVFLFDGGYAGLETVENDTANLCCLVDKESYAAWGKSWSGLLAMLRAASPYLARRLDGALDLWPRPLAVAALPYGYLQGSAPMPGLFRLGDQAAVIPSFAGDGIAMALHSAVLAAGAFLRGEDSTAFAHRLRRDFRGPLRAAGLLDRLAAQAASRRAAFLLARIFPALLPALVRQTRLGKEVQGTLNQAGAH